VVLFSFCVQALASLWQFPCLFACWYMNVLIYPINLLTFSFLDPHTKKRRPRCVLSTQKILPRKTTPLKRTLPIAYESSLSFVTQIRRSGWRVSSLPLPARAQPLICSVRAAAVRFLSPFVLTQKEKNNNTAPSSLPTLRWAQVGMKTDVIFSVPSRSVFYIFPSVSVFARSRFRICGSRKWCFPFVSE
jgi:hypothetical protein